jgi:hypothetical protein
MMKLRFTVLLCLLAMTCFCQEHLELKQFGFAMDAPAGWFKSQDEELVGNIEKFDLNNAQQDNMLKSLDAATKFIAYHKYDPKKTRGIIPTINVSIRATNLKSFDKFKLYINKEGEELSKVLENFTTTPPEVVVVNGTKIWFTTATYNLKINASDTVKLYTRMLYIYKSSYYISVNFIEEVGKEDNTALFDEVQKSIKVTGLPAKK